MSSIVWLNRLLFWLRRMCEKLYNRRVECFWNSILNPIVWKIQSVCEISDQKKFMLRKVDIFGDYRSTEETKNKEQNVFTFHDICYSNWVLAQTKALWAKKGNKALVSAQVSTDGKGWDQNETRSSKPNNHYK